MNTKYIVFLSIIALFNLTAIELKKACGHTPINNSVEFSARRAAALKIALSHPAFSTSQDLPDIDEKIDRKEVPEGKTRKERTVNRRQLAQAQTIILQK